MQSVGVSTSTLHLLAATTRSNQPCAPGKKSGRFYTRSSRLPPRLFAWMPLLLHTQSHARLASRAAPQNIDILYFHQRTDGCETKRGTYVERLVVCWCVCVGHGVQLHPLTTEPLPSFTWVFLCNASIDRPRSDCDEEVERKKLSYTTNQPRCNRSAVAIVICYVNVCPPSSLLGGTSWATFVPTNTSFVGYQPYTVIIANTSSREHSTRLL